MKSVLYTRTAATALRKHANRAKLIRTKIAQYADDASLHGNNVKLLAGVDAKRLRVGDFRVIFTETTDTITILDIGPRRDLRIGATHARDDQDTEGRRYRDPLPQGVRSAARRRQ